MISYRLNEEMVMPKSLLGYGLAIVVLIALGFALGVKGTPLSNCAEKYGYAKCSVMLPKNMY